MRTAPVDRRYVPPLAGVLVGCALASLLVVAGGTAVAQRSQGDSAGAVLEATHLPPLLTLGGDDVELSYDVHCAREGDEDPETGCDASGVVYVRSGPHTGFRPLPLAPASVDGLRRLRVSVPRELVAARGGFEYYAELRATGAADGLLVPAGGRDAPHRVLRLPSPIAVSLGVHAFGAVTSGTRIVSAPWGDGPASVGLEAGRNLPAIGAAAFDVTEARTVTLLDEAHRRALRWRSTAAAPERVPLAIDGRLADISVDEDGSIYVLESVAAPGRTPLVRHFDPNGRELAAVETAERGASQLRIGPGGPVVLQHPSHEWMPVAERGQPFPPERQRRHGLVGRPLRSAAEVVVLRRESDVLAALVAGDKIVRSWRVESGTPLAEVQLAEPIGQRFVLVFRVYSDEASEFVVLVLDGDGLAGRFSTPTDEWAETTPLGRFRIAGNRLYRLGSDASGAFVTSYDLGGPS